jgi:hypothetical protein
MNKIYLVLAFIFCLSGCIHNGPIRQISHINNKAVVFGSVKATYNGNDITRCMAFQFNNKSWDEYRVDKTGLIVMHLPLGYNEITYIFFDTGGQVYRYKMPKGYASFNISSEAETSYIGEIVIKITEQKDRKGLVGATIDDFTSKAFIDISVNDKTNEAQEILRNTYRVNTTLFTSIISIAPQFGDPSAY